MNFRNDITTENHLLFNELGPFLKTYSTTQVEWDYVAKYVDQNGLCVVSLVFTVLDRNCFEMQSDRVQFGQKMVSAIEMEFQQLRVIILKHFYNKDQINYFVNISMNGQALIASYGTGASRTSIPVEELEPEFKYIFPTIDENENDLLVLIFKIDYKDRRIFMDPTTCKRFGENLISILDEFHFEANVVNCFYNMKNHINYYVRILVEGQPVRGEQLQDLMKPIRELLEGIYPDINDGMDKQFLFKELGPFLKQYTEKLPQPRVRSGYLGKQIAENGQCSILSVFKVLDSNQFDVQADRVQFGAKIGSAIERAFPRFKVTIMKHFYNKIDQIHFVFEVFVDRQPLWSLVSPRTGPNASSLLDAGFRYTYTTVDEKGNDLLMLEFDVYYKDKKSFMDPHIREQFGRELMSTIGKQFEVEVNIVHCFYNMKNQINYYVRIDGEGITLDELLDENNRKFLEEKYPKLNH